MVGDECIKTASTGILQPACINDGICNEERVAINKGITETGKIDLRKANVKAQMLSLNAYASDYADASKYTEKRMILHTIKETIKTMKVPTLKGKVTKKAARQMNAQAREVAQDLQPIMKDAEQFLDQLNKDKIYPNLRPRSLDSAKERVRAYLDRMEEIFGNAYDTPTNIESQLKNPYVSPKTKLRIYDNTDIYYQKLRDILSDIQDKMSKLNIQYVFNNDDKENGAIIDECNEFITSFYQMLEKYRKKIDEWKRLEQSAAEAQGAVATEAEGVAMTESGSKPGGGYELSDQEKAMLAAGEAARQQAMDTAREQTRGADDASRHEERRKQSGDIMRDEAGGGRKRQVRKTRKLKRRPRKTTKRGGQRKRSMKRKQRSRKNTRRR
jgi:hypothetical protein